MGAGLGERESRFRWVEGAAESEDQPPASRKAPRAMCAEIVRGLRQGGGPAYVVLNLYSSLPAHLALPVSLISSHTNPARL